MSRHRVPLRELRISYARSSGPGGQNVNKRETKAVVHWCPAESGALRPAVIERFRKRYASRLTHDGEIVLSSDEHRTRPRNLEACRSRLDELIEPVLKPPKKRKRTRPTKASKERRLKQKRVKSEKKQARGRVKLG